ncbi:DJ-1/PfpI family protein [Pochonia chlamydosporia 170]|uniref:DJ-1/PfpI family protein n=1 Tax=Pochonia chlamydosporia 170 TaxID=1380566 RepID=A0A179G1J5_METCM|nr:DJ-1/PfpI family protein [Pochonia chlamydosporia 170]OAQ71099.2 DJ-1/PfpI family protein [Pochonia chlamydosporia 170]
MMMSAQRTVGFAALRARSLPVVGRGFSISTSSRLGLKESSSQTDADYDKHKRDSLDKQKKGAGHWKPELASDSEEAVKADRAPSGREEISKLQERTKKSAEETSKSGTKTAVPFMAFKDAGFHVTVATENGKSPACDAKMLQGLTQKLLGATASVVSQYNTVSQSPEWANPVAWTSPSFSLDDYNLVFLPGGHEKSVRQVIDSAVVHKLLLDFFPKTKKPSSKAVGAVCHGVMVLSEAKGEDGRSAIHDAVTTTLPARFEQVAFWGTRAFLGDYYKTYGACSADVEESVRKALDDPAKQFRGSLGPGPFVVEDETYNYVSARFPGDVALLSEKLVALARSLGGS